MTAFFLISLADIICQALERAQIWDYLRTLRLGSTRGLIINPISQFYFNHIGSRLNLAKILSITRGANLINNIFRGLMHYVCMGSVVVSSYLFFPAAFKTLSIEDGFENLKAKFLTGMRAGGYFWPYVHFINY